MPAITNSEAALLGLLCEKPMYSYEIEKTLEDRNMRYWTEISFFSIYRLLRKLETKGLVESEVRPGKNNVSQKVFTVTEAGRLAGKEKIAANLSSVERVIWQVDLSVANLSLLSNEEATRCLKEYIASIDLMIENYDALEAFFRSHGYPETDMALAVRPRLHLATERAWAQGFLQTLTGEA